MLGCETYKIDRLYETDLCVSTSLHGFIIWRSPIEINAKVTKKVRRVVANSLSKHWGNPHPERSLVVPTDFALIIIAQEVKKVIGKFRWKYFLKSCIILKVLRS